MDYEEALSWIHSLGMFSGPAGLGHITELCARLGDPQRTLQFVHVAGTNGKGSITTTLSTVLQHAGLRTGRYISPYVLDFRERIQVDGQMIGRDELAKVVDRVRPEVEAMRAAGRCPTEFEAVTAAAMLYFSQQRCDIVCLEVGLGGRFDATNVIDTALVSVIASIGLDHTHILGDTLGQIAFEKCGILRPGRPVVCYPRQPEEALEVIARRCAEEGCELIVPGAAAAQVTGGDVLGLHFAYDGLQVQLALPGAHQVDNALTAIAALRCLQRQGVCVTDADITAGIAQVRFPARMEVLSRDPLFVLDGAHNPDGVQALAAALAQLPGRRWHLIVGMLKDKDYQHALTPLLALAESVCCVQVPVPRSLTAAQLAETVRRQYSGPVDACSLEQALEAAVGRARQQPGGAVVAAGSLYLAGQLRPVALQMFSHRPE